MFEPNKKVQSVDESPIRRLFAKGGPNTVDLSIGQTDYGPPEFVHKAIDKAHYRYGPTEGLKKLREEIALRYGDLYGLKINSDNVLITGSGTEALFSIASSFFGGKVLIPNPGFVMYPSQIRLVGSEVVWLPHRKENNFKIDVDELVKICEKENPSYMILNFPSNPTGSIQNRKSLQEIADFCQKKGIGIISDEVYDLFTYDDRDHACMSQLTENALVVNSLSKSIGLCGSRLGFVIGKEEVIKNVKKAHQPIMACAPIKPQYGVIAALENWDETKKFLKGKRELYQKRRDFMVKILNMIGLKCHKPEGAFYTFPDIGKFGMSSSEFSKLILEKADVKVVDGGGFGSLGEGHVRISYATSEENIKEGLERIKKVIETI